MRPKHHYNAPEDHRLASELYSSNGHDAVVIFPSHPMESYTASAGKRYSCFIERINDASLPVVLYMA